MKKLFPLLLLLVLPFFTKATHIVGGELYYEHLGGDQYQVTLLLYRDCGNGNAGYPGTAQIRAWYDNGQNRIDINIPFPGATVVPPVIDSCVIDPGVCVESAEYTTTVTLPPVDGGYHLLYEICCRNGSISNVVNPLNTGAAFYSYVPADTTITVQDTLNSIWVEDFNLPNNTLIDNGPTAWSRTVAGGTDYAGVTGGQFVATDTDGEVVWSSEYVDITSYTNGANIQVDLDQSNTNFEGTDYIEVYYRLNNGPEILFPINGSNYDDFSPKTAHASCLNADSIAVVIRMNNNANAESHIFDNVIISECALPDTFAFGLNSAPIYDTFPPIFLCAVDTFVFNHSATDADGDSLVYSLCDPYDEYSANVNTPPPFVNNVPTIPSITWETGYNANQPLGAPPLTIDPVTGVITGTPQQLGQFVVGVCVQEWRNDSLFNETRRDFQFNIVNCPQPAVANVDSVDGIISVCNGNAVTFPNETDPDATTYLWDFGDLTTTNDTSTQKFPTYTYPDTGSYNVVLIINDGTACADTAYATVNVGFANAAFTSDAPKCENEIVNFTDNSTASNNATITNWDWNFGDSNTSTSQNPNNQYVNSGGYTVELIVTTDIGCSDTVTQLITIDPAPTVDAGANDTVCGNNSTFTLNGSVTNATGGVWSGGAGTYNPNNTTLNADYTPSPAEITAGSAQLILTTTGNGICQAVTDTLDIIITPEPTVDAGVDDTVCANNPDVSLNGAVTIATGGIWSGGAGTFNPNNTTLNATYTPTLGEITAGSVQLILTTTGNGDCNPVADTMNIVITPAPIVDAGPDQAVCENNPDAVLNGSVTAGATTGTWSGGAGSYNPNNNDLNATYTPTGGEITTGSVTLILTSTNNGNCLPETDTVIITITPEPIVDAGADQIVCANNADVTLNGSVTGGTTTGQWSTSGTGTFSPNDSALNATYTPSAADTAAGSVTIVLTSTNNGGCIAETDTMVITITPAPVVDAGANQTVCANNADAPLNGSVTGGSNTGIWSTTGTGNFNPNNTTLNATYEPSPADTIAGSVTLYLTSTNNGTCLPEVDSVVITITPAPVVDAGLDANVCADSLQVALSGSVSVGATTGSWSTLGTGTFTPNNTTLNATYNVSSQDSLAGTVTLILTSTNNGNCLAETDTLVITITEGGLVDAGANDTVCANNAAVALNGTISGGASEGIWTTSGSGTFTPNDTALTVTYNPSAADTAAGSVILYLTATNSCDFVYDSVIITITPAPNVDAGPDQAVCANNPDVVLNGSVNGGATTGTWSGGAGTFNPNNNTLNATYTPTGAEIIAGTVTLVLTSTNNGNCLAETDTMVITITAEPVVDAGSDQTVCANNGNTFLNGSVTGGTTTGQWTTSGTGTFSPNDSALNATYIPSDADTAAGSVTIILTSTNNGACAAESDTMIITITPAPFVTAGADQTVCANNADVTLNGGVSFATGGQWTTSGSGTFSPNDSTLNATYSPSAADTAAGSVTLYLTSTGNGDCFAELDSMVITITPAPVVDAGSDQLICVDSLFALLNGSVSVGSTTGSWSTSGTGTFTPNNTTLNATYNASSQDSTNGTVTLILTSTNNGNCLAETDTMVIDILPAGIVDAGNDTTVCANNAFVNLSGSVTGGATEGIWTTSGSGTFAPSDTSLTATYTPSAADTAAGTVTIYLAATNSCNAVNDSLVITITPAPNVDAGPDIFVCDDSLTTVPLNGTVTAGASTGSWATAGTGTFTPNNTTLNATYNASSADTANGSVMLILTSTNNGNCLAESDTMFIYFIDPATALAGIDDTTCANTPYQLSGAIIDGFGTGIWSTTGSGSFSPDDTSLNATYIPDYADTTAPIMIILTSTNNGGCPAAIDTLILVVTPGPFVDAGPNDTVCANNADVLLNGSVTGDATTGIWTTSGTGIFLPNDSTLNATYSPSPADTVAGSVTLTLTSTNNGGCLAESDTVNIQITPSPIVDAGPDQFICADTMTADLAGSVTGGATTGQWTTLGSGTFTPNNNTLNATYNLSSADTAAGMVTLVLTSTNNGNCLAVTDTMVITITSIATVLAGNDTTVCANNASVLLSGDVIGGNGTGIWTTSGSGTFSPSDTSLNATYTPSSGDINSGFVQLILFPTAACTNEGDTIDVFISPAPTADAGLDTAICAGETIALAGVVTVASGGLWTTTGTGTFLPNDSTLNATYVPSQADLDSGFVTIILETTGNGNCLPEYDTLVITIESKPTANFLDDALCTGFVVNFTDSSFNTNGAITNWNWDFGDGNNSTNQNPSNSYGTEGTYDVTLIISTAQGCTDTITLPVTTAESITADFTFAPDPPAVAQTVQFTDASAVDPITWNWDFGDESGTSTNQNPTYSYSDTGTFIVVLTVTNDDGCLDTAEAIITITSTDQEMLPVAIPSAFTPNGDGVNDVLMVRGGPFTEFDFNVFNEWGNLIFQSSDQATGWNGNFQGKLQPAGTYVYTFRGIGIDEVEYKLAGDVTLINLEQAK